MEAATDMAKPTCSKCARPSHIGGLCAFHWREGGVAPKPSPRPAGAPTAVPPELSSAMLQKPPPARQEPPSAPDLKRERLVEAVKASGETGMTKTEITRLFSGRVPVGLVGSVLALDGFRMDSFRTDGGPKSVLRFDPSPNPVRNEGPVLLSGLSDSS